MKKNKVAVVHNPNCGSSSFVRLLTRYGNGISNEHLDCSVHSPPCSGDSFVDGAFDN
ncbi:hypothetical protein T09_8844, partial [Trichinella sp. T9]